MDLLYNKNEQLYFLDQQTSFKIDPKLMQCLSVNETDNWAAKPHSHSYAELIYVRSGSGSIKTQDNVYPLIKGDVVILNAGISHFQQSDSDNPLSLIVLAIGKFQINGLPRNHLIPDDFRIIYHSNEMELVLNMYFSNILSELERQEPFYMEIATNATKTLVMFLYRLISQYYDVSFASNQNSLISKAQTYIDEHYLEDISLDDVAKHCKVSKSHLSHIFEAIKHMTIVSYIRRKRFTIAVDLLISTNLPINDIAKRSGFPNANYFSRVFRAEYNMTPRIYRQNLTKE